MQIFLKENCIRIILVDLDGTFYPYSFYKEKYYAFAVQAVMELFGRKQDDAIEILNEYGIYENYIPNRTKSLTDLVLMNGIGINEWNEYRDEHFVITGFAKTQTVKIETLINLKREFKLYLVTNDTITTTKRILKELSIDLKIFSGIYTSEDMYIRETKKEKDYIYSLIKEKNKVSFKNMLVIGDRYTVDILPLLKYGGNGILIKEPNDIDKVPNIIKGFSTPN